MQPNFKYHGHNTYAYILAKYGKTKLLSENDTNNKNNSYQFGIKNDDHDISSTVDINILNDNKNMNSTDMNNVNDDTTTCTKLVDNESRSSHSLEEVVVVVDTFDFITIQLYEGYSHVQYKIYIQQLDPSEVLIEFCHSVYNGWDVYFEEEYNITRESKLGGKFKYGMKTIVFFFSFVILHCYLFV